MNKREFLKTGLIGAIGLTSISFRTNTGFLSVKRKEFQIPELPYSYEALEPYIDKQTMMLHHTKHHAGYAARFNEALKKEGLSPNSAVDILREASKYNSAIKNNGGGFLNHKMFWKFLSPNGGGKPVGNISSLIERDFGSFAEFKEVFGTAAKKHFGSGWAWLIIQDNKLKVTSTSNQDTPIMDSLPKNEQGFPLLNLDVWEHAYYLKYQSRRGEYVDAFWNIVNWERVNERLKKYGGD